MIMKKKVRISDNTNTSKIQISYSKKPTKIIIIDKSIIITNTCKHSISLPTLTFKALGLSCRETYPKKITSI